MIAICDFCLERGLVTQAAVKFQGSYYCSHCARWRLGPYPAITTKVPA